MSNAKRGYFCELSGKGRQLIVIVFALLFASHLPIAAGDDRNQMTFETLTTKSGKIYRDVTVRKITAAEIRIFHSTGSAGIRISDLGEELQEMFGYSSAAAQAEIARATEAEQARLRAMRKRIARSEENKAGDGKAKKELADVLKKEWYVAEVMEDGLLVHDVVVIHPSGSLRGIGGGGHIGPPVKRPGNQAAFVTNFDSEVVDGDIIHGSFRKIGRKKIERALDRTMTVDEWRFITRKNVMRVRQASR